MGYLPIESASGSSFVSQLNLDDLNHSSMQPMVTSMINEQSVKNDDG